MYSSVKFLSPIVTGGLVAPAFFSLASLFRWTFVLVLDELPHAASASPSRAATTPNRTLRFIIASLFPSWICRKLNPVSDVLRQRRPYRFLTCGVLFERCAPGREEALHPREQKIRQKGECGDADRRSQHAR